MDSLFLSIRPNYWHKSLTQSATLRAAVHRNPDWMIQLCISNTVLHPSSCSRSSLQFSQLEAWEPEPTKASQLRMRCSHGYSHTTRHIHTEAAQLPQGLLHPHGAWEHELPGDAAACPALPSHIFRAGVSPRSTEAAAAASDTKHNGDESEKHIRRRGREQTQQVRSRVHPGTPGGDFCTMFCNKKDFSSGRGR